MAPMGQMCEVCGTIRDVARIICLMTGPEGSEGPLMNVVYVCSGCAARAIQRTTGFRAEATLESWYHVRGRARAYKLTKKGEEQADSRMHADVVDDVAERTKRNRAAQ